jgi:CBS domain-containing protein
MRAADIMTRQVVAVSPETAIEEGARLMIEQRVSGLPVTDANGAVVGILTEGDLLRRVETGTDKHHAGWYGLLFGPGRLAQEYIRSRARTVAEVMTGKIVSVAPETPLDEVVALMEVHHIKRVPVIDRGSLVGIISRANLVAALAGILAQPQKPALSDDEIRRALLAEIDRRPWGPRQSVDITVADGIVELHGTVLDDRERIALKVAAENLPGVKAVRDYLVWVEPASGLVVSAQDPAAGDRIPR